NGASLAVDGGVAVTARGITSAWADAPGGTFGLVGIGRTDAFASVKPTVSSFVGNGATVDALGTVTLTASHNYNAAGAVLTDNRANATASSTTGGFVGGSAVKAVADSDVNVSSVVGAGARVSAGGDLNIFAR